MADIIRTDVTLKIDTMYVDGDTRLVNLKNPKETITTSEITELNRFIQANNALIGDKDQATFGRIKSVTRVTKQDVILDLV